ncbi:MAG: hypothetical protein ACR2GO_00835 [Candidatus Limnocylindria bacterium]
MATPKPGEIRCPTCHRSTAPAAFCTPCGSAIPSDARIRPRGMDRDELQDRIRARRSGADPYRRGGSSADEVTGGYQRFEPEPDDSLARRTGGSNEQRRDALGPPAAAAGGAVGAPSQRPDVTREHPDWLDRPSNAGSVPPPAPGPAAAPRPSAQEPEHVDNYDETAYDDAGYSYEYDEWDDGRERRSAGVGAFAILGFLALGVLALFTGAVLAGVFNSEPNIGGADPTPTPSPSIAESAVPSEAASAAPSVDSSAAPSGEPAASGDPIEFPDGFIAEAQPCIPGSASTNGCDSNATSNSGNVWVWVGFENGTENDVIGAEVIGPDGTTVGDGSIDLATIGCSPTCPGGWTYFPFGNLQPGTYQVEITRNGDPAGSTSFEVT